MSNLNVTTQNNTLVVDSRLIAEDLGIEHRALVQTIKKTSKRYRATLWGCYI
jgi:phage regulator Rha-like protein